MQEHQGFVCHEAVEQVLAFIEGFHLRDPKLFWERIGHYHRGEGIVGFLYQGLNYGRGFSLDSFHHDVQLILHLLHLLLLFGSGSSCDDVGLLRC